MIISLVVLAAILLGVAVPYLTVSELRVLVYAFLVFLPLSLLARSKVRRAVKQ